HIMLILNSVKPLLNKQGLRQEIRYKGIPFPGHFLFLFSLMKLLTIQIIRVSHDGDTIPLRTGMRLTKMSCTLCPPNWQRMGDDTCYYISSGKKTWEGSRNFCASQNSTLLMIKDKQKIFKPPFPTGRKREFFLSPCPGSFTYSQTIRQSEIVGRNSPFFLAIITFLLSLEYEAVSPSLKDQLLTPCQLHFRSYTKDNT
uniref:C-type lectin domain-containing protein n=1 Tax=Gopherus agassizii TaxID=38772 RepID=A0A452HSV0_9SAUR